MTELRNLHICFLAGTLGQGGAERQLYYVLKTLREQRASLRLLCLTTGEFWEDKIRALGVPVTWVGQSRSRVLRLIRIVEELRKFPNDVLQSQHCYTNLYAVAVARILGLNEIGSIRTDGMRELEDIGLGGRLSVRCPRVIVANSKAAIRHARKQGVPSENLVFLPNVVDTTKFRPAAGRDGGPIRILAAGRLVRQKRHDRFLSIFGRVHRRLTKEVRGVIVGAGRLRSRLEHQAAKLGLFPGLVEFRGTVSDMASVYHEVDVIALTSDWEGTPNVLLEAMASGLPVVATRVGGVPEIVQDKETGFLADPWDEEVLVDALLRLSSDEHLRRRMGCKGREYTLAYHSLSRLHVFLRDLYRMVLS